MKLDVYTVEGQKSGEIELPDAIFNADPHEHSMYMDVRSYLAHQRQGTHKTKGRAEVSGGGKKPWKQKGRGTARAGSTRSPLWVGGGTVHGPKPHTYSVRLPKKMKRLARKSALSLRTREQNIVVVEDFSFDTPKTKNMVAALKALGIYGEKILQLLPEDNASVLRSSNNIEKLSTMVAAHASTYHILSNKKLLIHKSAIEKISQTFGL